MRNKINQDEIKELVDSKYPFTVTDIKIGPRGFVAETFIIQTNMGKFFIKASELGGYARYIEESLPVLKEMYELGYEQITVPQPASNGTLFFKHKDHIVVVFNFIEGHWSFDCDFDTVVGLFAQVHKLTPRIKSPIEKEDFKLPLSEKYLHHFDYLLSLESNNQYEKELSRVFLSEKNRFDALWKLFMQVSDQCRDTLFDLVLTHGDGLANTMEGEDGKVYIFDWDEIVLAPAERDNWFMLDSKTRKKFLNVYKNYFPKYEPNELAYQFYVLRRYFDDIEGFIIEILSQPENKDKEHNLKELYEIFNWLDPVISEFITL